MRFATIMLSLLLAAPVVSGAQQRDTAARGEGPPAAYSFGLAFDEARQRLVFFGGYFQGGYISDTWEWDGARWSRVSQTGPRGRNSPRMVYDAARRRVIMFGGDTREGAFGDTWEWDGREWREIPGEGPPARTLHGMAYDSNRQRVVVFSGRSGNEYRRDTWELDATGWKKVADDGPPPRMMHGMTYDPKRQRVVVVGGSRAIAAPVEGDVLGDVWTWDGTRWEQMPGGPGVRDHTAATFDPIREAVMVYGGARPSGALADAWTWAGADRWDALSVSAVGARAGHLLATDTRNRRVLLYGGFGGSASMQELWEYSATGWKRSW